MRDSTSWWSSTLYIYVGGGRAGQPPFAGSLDANGLNQPCSSADTSTPPRMNSGPSPSPARGPTIVRKKHLVQHALEAFRGRGQRPKQAPPRDSTSEKIPRSAQSLPTCLRSFFTRHVQPPSPTRRPGAQSPADGVEYHCPPSFCQVLNRHLSTAVRFWRLHPSDRLLQSP